MKGSWAGNSVAFRLPDRKAEWISYSSIVSRNNSPPSHLRRNTKGRWWVHR
jgi:hypothetical protein